MKLAKILFESKREEYTTIKIQKIIRGFICRKRYNELRKAVIVVQSGNFFFIYIYIYIYNSIKI